MFLGFLSRWSKKAFGLRCFKRKYSLVGRAARGGGRASSATCHGQGNERAWRLCLENLTALPPYYSNKLLECNLVLLARHGDRDLNLG